jgi:hypothetical protein
MHLTCDIFEHNLLLTQYILYSELQFLNMMRAKTTETCRIVNRQFLSKFEHSVYDMMRFTRNIGVASKRLADEK